VYTCLVSFVEFLSFANRNYLLVFVEATNIKLIFEGDLLMIFAFALGSLSQPLLEFIVERVKVPLLLGPGHEEDLRQLRIVLLELLSHMGRHRTNVVSNVEFVIIRLCSFILNLLRVLLLRQRPKVLSIDRLVEEIRSVLIILGEEESVNPSEAYS
jgi:hypothetical protein